MKRIGHISFPCLLFAAALAAAVPASVHAQDNDAMTQFARGVLLLEQGRADQAIGPLAEAWRLSGQNPTIGERLAQAYYATRDIVHADQVASRVLDVDPSSILMLHMKARLCLARGDTRGAIGYLERARAASPQSIETERMLATLYSENGDTDLSIAALERCIQLEPDVPDLRVAYGEMLMVAGRADDAEAALKVALEMDPGDEAAVESLVDLYQAQQRKTDAIAVLEAYAELPDATPVARLRLAQAYVDAGRTDDAIRVLEGAVKRGGAGQEADLLLGRTYFETGRYEDSKRVFLSLYKPSNASPELARILADLSLKTGDVAAARGYFDRAIQLAPDDYRGYMALFFAQSQKFTRDSARIEMSAKDAVALLEKAAARAPSGDVDAQFSLGMAYSAIDSLDAAREHLARASELEPERQDVLFNLAATYEKLGRYPDAERVLSDLYELAPDDASVCNFYGYLLALMNKDLDRAERLIRHALEKEPDNAYYIDSLGWVYYQKGDYARAVAELERAQRIVGEDATILEHLGDAYSGLARYKDALAVYQHSSRLQEPNSKLREKIQSMQRRIR